MSIRKLNPYLNFNGTAAKATSPANPIASTEISKVAAPPRRPRAAAPLGAIPATTCQAHAPS